MAFGGAQGSGGAASGSTTSDVNTTTTPLSSGATYTGSWEKAPSDGVTVSCKADNSGTLYFDFSNDGTNTDTFPVNGFKVSSGIHEYHTARVNSRYFRVRLVNDTGAQTYLRLYTYFGTHTVPNAPMNQSVGLDTDAIFTRSTIAQDEIRIGRRSGVDGWTKFGRRDGLTAANGDETVWATGGNYTVPTAASTYTITYDGTGGGSTDGAGTTGATELTFYYIDSDGLPAIGTHTLGTDGSDATSFSGFGINRLAVSASGTADCNNTAIVVTHTTGGAKMAAIAAGVSVTEQPIFHVGANHDAVAKFLWINCAKTGGGTPVVKVKGWVHNRAVDTKYLVYQTIIDTGVELTQSVTDPIGFSLSPTDTLYFTADTSTNNAEINLRFSLNQYQRT